MIRLNPSPSPSPSQEKREKMGAMEAELEGLKGLPELKAEATRRSEALAAHNPNPSPNPNPGPNPYP